jgi:hypothetical protein
VAAIFSDLHDVSQVLTEHIREEIGIVDVQPGSPRDVAATTEAAARITLLYTTPQQAHRNDPPERQTDGTRRFPPLALSCFYLVTTSGADGDDPIAAHHALGQIMTLYHDTPSLELPLSDNPGADPGAFTELGEGVMTVVQVPMLLDQIDKIWTSVDVQLQPWVLLEVSPVQLVSLKGDLEPAPVVRPGGIDLEVRAGTRPLLIRVTPEAVRPGGRVRIDAVLPGTVEAVTAGGVEVAAGDPLLVTEDGGAPLLLSLTGALAGLEGATVPLTIRAAGLVSRRGVLRLAPEGAPAVDAPPSISHDPSTDLVLTGANLAAADEAVTWPDAGVAAPTEVHTLALTGAAAGTVTIASSELDSLPAGRGPWRLTVRLDQLFTPYVLVELES